MNDPFTTLRLPPERIGPDTGFATRLRARIADAIGEAGSPDALPIIDLPQRRSTTMSDTTTEPTTTSPPSEATVTPPAVVVVLYICLHAAAAALRWYSDVFGAVETVRYTGDDGRIGHAEMRVAGALLMLSEPYPEYGVVAPQPGASSFTLHLQVPNVDEVHAAAVAAAATSVSEPSDQSYGERSCTIIDPFGHRWMVQTPIATPTLDEINAAMEGFTATAPTDDDA